MNIYYKVKRSAALPVCAFLILVIMPLSAANTEDTKKVTISVYGLKGIGIPQSLAESLQEHLEARLDSVGWEAREAPSTL